MSVDAAPGIGEVARQVDASADAHADTNAYLGMMIFLGAWVMMFAALFLAYGVVRAQATRWPPPGETPLPRALPGLNTLILVASGWLLRRAGAALRDARERAALRRLGGALALGALFLGLQIGIWRAMTLRGLTPGSGIYGSVFFALTGFHALHVLCGLVALAVIAVQIARRTGRGRGDRRGLRATAPARALRVTTLFWDFIAVVWALMYLTIYLL